MNPSKGFWGPGTEDLHTDFEQIKRQKSALTIPFDHSQLDIKSSTCAIKDYVVTPDSCTCLDASHRMLPCKHMYRLAHELGFFHLDPELLKNEKADFWYSEGFKWAVSPAFRKPVSVCRFEQGDMLYDTMKGYNAWVGGICPTRYCIQVTYPPRGSSSLGADEEADLLFRQNWNRTVMFRFYDNVSNSMELMSSTQGRLYELLRTGDLNWISENRPLPPMPILASDVASCLKCPWFIWQADISFSSRLSHSNGDRTVFLMPYDCINNISRRKYRKIRSALTSHFITDISFISPPAIYPLMAAPHVKIAYFDVVGSTLAVRDVLEKALFQSRSARSTFSIAMHGCYLQGTYKIIRTKGSYESIPIRKGIK